MMVAVRSPEAPRTRTTTAPVVTANPRGREQQCERLWIGSASSTATPLGGLFAPSAFRGDGRGWTPSPAGLKSRPMLELLRRHRHRRALGRSPRLPCVRSSPLAEAARGAGPAPPAHRGARGTGVGISGRGAASSARGALTSRSTRPSRGRAARRRGPISQPTGSLRRQVFFSQPSSSTNRRRNRSGASVASAGLRRDVQLGPAAGRQRRAPSSSSCERSR